MASLYIEEFADLGRNGAPVLMYPPLAIQEVTIGGTSTAAEAFNSRTRYVRLTAGAACRFKIAGTAPTAADNATSSRLASGVVADIGVQSGHILAVITAA